METTMNITENITTTMETITETITATITTRELQPGVWPAEPSARERLMLM